MPLVDISYHAINRAQKIAMSGISKEIPVRGLMHGNSEQLLIGPAVAQAKGNIQESTVTARLVATGNCRVMVSSSEPAPAITEANSQLMLAAHGPEDILVPTGHFLVVKGI